MTERQYFSKSCPGCKMQFFTQNDLDAHTKALGAVCADKTKLRKIHEDLEWELERKHGGANKLMRDFERIILEHYGLLTKDPDKQRKGEKSRD